MGMAMALGLWLLPSTVSAAETPAAQTAPNYAWQRVDSYTAPNFEAFFADDPEGTRKLEAWLKAGELETRPASELVPAVRQGLRRYTGPRLPILRSLGNRFIWSRPAQDPAVIELMYHAAGFSQEPDPQNTRHFAIYFGLSVTQPKTPNILRALAEIALATRSPDILSRIAWATAAPEDRDRLVAFLYKAPAVASAEKEKLNAVIKILSGELSAFAWATEETRKRVKPKFEGDLPAIHERLRHGSTEERRETLQLIMTERIDLIMTDVFIDAFARCALDQSPEVRSLVAKIVGNTWIWQAKDQSSEALELLFNLSHDTQAQVRYDVVYYGLSTARSKSNVILHRLVEMALEPEDAPSRSRILWGLRPDKEEALRVIAEYLADSDEKRAQAAEQLRRDLAGEDRRPSPPINSKPKPVRDWAGEITARLKRPFKPFTIRLVDDETIPVTQREQVAAGKRLIVVIGDDDRVRTLDPRQIADVLER